MPAHRRASVDRRLVATPAASAEACIGALSRGVAMTGLTMGQFSLLDLVEAVLRQTGPAGVVVSTWTTGIRDAERAAWLLEHGAITSFALLTDRSFPGRQPAYCKALVARFGEGAIRATRTHAKFALIRNAGWNVCIRSSMNLNANPRFEQFDLDDDAGLCAYFADHVDAQPVGFDESAVAAQWADHDTPETPRGMAARKARERTAKARLARLGVTI